MTMAFIFTRLHDFALLRAFIQCAHAGDSSALFIDTFIAAAHFLILMKSYHVLLYRILLKWKGIGHLLLSLMLAIICI